MLVSVTKTKMMKFDLGILKKRFDVIAIIAAVLYFTYQKSDGSDISNLSIKINTERSEIDTLYDHLKIEVILKNEGNASLILHDIKAKVFSVDSSFYLIINKFIGTEELAEKDTLGRTRLSRDWKIKERLKYRFAVNETTQYAVYIKVPREKVCAIETVILCERNRFFLFTDFRQWKASSISLPNPIKNLK